MLRTQALFRIAINTPADGVFVNGKFCKDPKLVTEEDFFTGGLHKAGTPNAKTGYAVTPVNVNQIPGLNTLGISIARIDYAVNGQNPPHTHPRASEILYVAQGTLLVGLVTSNPENRLLSKVLTQGEVFVFPEGLVHFQSNVGKYPAIALASLSSQHPGAITIADTVFGSNPAIDPKVLARAFQLDARTVIDLQNKFKK